MPWDESIILIIILEPSTLVAVNVVGVNVNWYQQLPIQYVAKKPKRIRTAFTIDQVIELEKEYARYRYLNLTRRTGLANILQMNEKTIKIWFATINGLLVSNNERVGSVNWYQQHPLNLSS